MSRERLPLRNPGMSYFGPVYVLSLKEQVKYSDIEQQPPFVDFK